MAYYASGSYDSILCVQVVEICEPKPNVLAATVGAEVKPIAKGYSGEGLSARVSAGVGDSLDDFGDYLYQHAGQHSYSPKNGAVFAIRPTVNMESGNNEYWKAEVTWMETDPMNVQWPFEIDQYLIDWPGNIRRFVRGNMDDFGADIVITNAYTAELQKYQYPNGHALDVGADGRFRTKGEGKALLKLTGDDNVWFLPVESIMRTNRIYYTLTPSRVNVGAELELRSGTRSGVALGVQFNATSEIPGYIYRPGTPGGNYDVNLYSETNSASAIYAVSTNGDIEVWWSERFQEPDMPAPIAIPVLPQIYRPVWPAPDEAPQIVIASQEGSANEMAYARYGAAYFDTANATMTLPWREYFNGDAGTVMFWTRSAHYNDAMAVTNAPGRLITVMDETYGTIAAEIVNDGNGPLVRARVGNTSAELPLLKDDAPNVWHHVAITFGGKEAPSLHLDDDTGNLRDDATADAVAPDKPADKSPVESAQSTANDDLPTDGVRDYNGETQLEAGVCYEVNGAWTSTTLTVNGTPESPTGLILADGATLTVNGGIRVFSGNSLNVYARSSDANTMGRLIATSGDYCAGIGGEYGKAGGEITIHGGIVTATGGFAAAGIGGGCYGAGGKCVIYNGIVTATGGNEGAGIGGGYQRTGGEITIYGGCVTALARGGSYAFGAGIGGGSAYQNEGCPGGTITISGGTVTATGNSSGAGIGGGYAGSGGTITISGVQCAGVVPAWGESAVKGGDVVEFSAPTDEQTVSDDLHVRFVGYKLFVTGADGMEALVAEKSETSGTYTHENGTSARLVWTVRELHRAAAEVEHATVTGSGYYPIGTTVEFAATPDDGWRILDWTVNGESVGTTASSIKVQVSGAMVIAPVLRPKATTVAFYGLSGVTAGAKVGRFVNELDADLFSGTAMAVEKEAGAGRIPTYASLKPAHVIYGDATRQSVIAEDPQSVLICPEDGFEFNQGGGVIPLEGLASFIADEDTVTVECFVHTRYAKVNQYATLWSADLGNEKYDSHNLYCPNGSAASAGAKSVALVGAQTGNVGSGDLTGWLDEGWHHVAVVYDKPSQTARLFVDYKDRGSKPMSIQTLDEVTPLYLGAALSNNGNKANNFNGYVSCLRVSRWAIVKEDFMRAAYDVADDGTIALYSPRGMEGTAVGAFGNKKGEKLCSAVVETLDANGKGAEGVALPVYSDDIPGPSIYANAAALAAEKPLPLVKRPMSIAFVNEETNRSSYVRIDNLCTVVSSFEQFTIEFFAKHISSTNVWRTVIAFNMRDVACSGDITKFSIPGASITHRTFQHPDFPVIGTPLSEDTAWHHYALAYDGVRMHIFIDYVDRGYVVVDRAQGFGSVILGNTYNTTYGNGCRQKESFEGKLSTLRVTRGFLGADQFMVTGPRPQSGFGIFVQ